MLDARVSGGSEGAAKGTLSIMVGGQADSCTGRCRFCRPWASRITHAGPNGAGQMVKLVNQVIVAGNRPGHVRRAAAGAGGRCGPAQSAGGRQRWRGRQPDAQPAGAQMACDWRPGFTIALQ